MTFKLSLTELFIIDILESRGGFIKTSDIVVLYKKRRTNTPKQTIYRALASLKKKEVVVIVKGHTSVNTIWIKMLKNKLGALELYSLQKKVPDKVSNTFSSFMALAPVMANYASVLISQSDVSRPIIFINPHQWFYVAREWSEDQLFDKLELGGYTLWQGINKVSDVDRLILKNKFKNRPSILGSFITPKTGEGNIYVSVFGDYVMKVSTTPHFAETLNKLYAKNMTITEEFVLDIEDALKNSGSVKLTIVKNAEKADWYRKFMKKYIG